MAGKYIHQRINPPKRVQILKADTVGGYWKPGQFGYAVAYSTHPGMFTLDQGDSKAGDLSYLVAKSADMAGGALWFSANGLRFTGKAAAPGPSHARKKKLTHAEAKSLLQSEGINFNDDYHAAVSMSQGNRIAEVAKMAGYRKSKNAPGSTARMYFQRLSRLGAHATRRGSSGKLTVYDVISTDNRTKKETILHRHFSTSADAREAANEYKTLKRPGVTYSVRSRKTSVQPTRWNRED